ncbi:N-acetyltransferase [Vibrio parahaemolyticus]|uniref:GNAT family N-acetyltransferase n=1 Tax=Vibrio parahaemolyticus TaxID=670 RepID=UPI00041551DD|nr:N-acetyltransferase [Vibrio parahaemolyticus]EJG1709461.1 N-acetyltransferase [Vibrio parahaemolyticus]EJG1740858.1 N-acetyltransferase [Vibrio parahaemolyticus]EJG1778189.1 N-acetyltransferase [Vibrio parahaemolyticus]MDZ5178590.1 N-acetyltransferase [Vibrio parahaemolyticus]SUQ08733.1 acetyltransferase [Vibrio parahaemolyticus]
MKIRAENHSDITEIETLIYRAFENHPHHEPGAKPTEHLIVNKLRDAKVLSLSLVCEDQTGIIAHIAFSPILINGEESVWYGLGPVSVMPERQGEGIGGALIREGLSQLKTQGIEGVVLLGEPKYYGRFGFESQPNLTFPGVPSEYFLAISLANNIPTGEVAYHSAFFDN